MDKSLLAKFSPFVNEVRKRLLFVVYVFISATILGFFIYERVIRFIIGSLDLQGVNIVFTSPFQFLNLAISTGVSMGVVFAVPLLVYQLFSFLKPALKPREYKMIVGFIPVSVILFIVGFAFGAFIMKWQIEIFLASSLSLGIGNILDVSRLLSMIIMTSAFIGAGFQFPILLLILLRLGVLKHKQLAGVRKWFYVGSFIFAILLPADSILADILLAMPLILLFELTLLSSRIFGKKSVFTNTNLKATQ